MNNFKIAVIICLVALCTATNYALIGLANVKVMDIIVFITGFCFGPLSGALTGILSWTVYGVINPYGFVPQIWLATMFSESIYGIVGGFLGKNLGSIDLNYKNFSLNILLGAFGFILTLIYDLITNLVYASTFDVPIFISIILLIPFSALHELSNALLFGVASVPLIRAIKKLSGVM